MSHRPRPLSSWISVFALLLQLALPTAHAQAWAQRAGTPMLYAMCGQMPAAQRAADDPVPAEWQQSQKKLAALSCELCGAMQAAAVAGPPAGSIRFSVLATHERVLPALRTARAVQRVVLPQLRGPPVQV